MGNLFARDLGEPAAEDVQVATLPPPSAAPVRRGRRQQRLVGTLQQAAFWDEILEGSANIELDARAGCGKSSSAREGMWRRLEADPDVRCSYVAFNRAIADEFQEQLPPGARAQTMHGAGFAAIREAFPNVGDPHKFKMYDIVDTFLPRRDLYTKKTKSAVVKLAGLCKGHLSDGTDPATLDRLAAAHGVNLAGLRMTVHDLVPKLLAKCLEQTGVIDFSDMPWMPVKLGLEFPPVDDLYVDEAQDLDPCQHALVRRMAGEGRLIVIGDPRQAIYGFRGADTRSMSTLAAQLESTEWGLRRLPLTMTRRCPKSHVALARQLVPDFESLPEAPGGRVDVDCDPDSLLQPGIMALCRTNAPLVAAAYRLVGLGVPVAVQGRDLGEGLAALIESFGVADVAGLMKHVEDYRAHEVDRLGNLENSEGEVEAVNDRCNCLVAASQGCGTVAEVLAKIRGLFLDVSVANQGRYVLLSSIHRAKGREADHVAILRPDLLPHKMATTDEAIEQEHNLAYVAVTRAKKRLSFCGPVPYLFHGA